MNGIEEIRRSKRVFDQNEQDEAITVYVGRTKDEDVKHPLMMRRLHFLHEDKDSCCNYTRYKSVDSILIGNGYEGNLPDLSLFSLKSFISNVFFPWNHYSEFDLSDLEEISLCISCGVNEICFDFPRVSVLTLIFEEREMSEPNSVIDLSRCTNVRELNLINFKGIEIRGLDCLQKMETVCLGNEFLSNLDLISYNTNLKTINIAAPISSLNGIEKYSRLENLVLSRSKCDETCHISDLSNLKGLHNLKYVEIENDGPLDKSILDSSVETLIDEEDRDKAYVQGAIMRAIWLAVAGQFSSDRKPLDKLSDDEKKQRIEEKNLSFEEKVMKILKQSYLTDEYEDINPWGNRASHYGIILKELYMDALKETFPQIDEIDDIKRMYEYEKKIRYGNDDLAGGLFYIVKREVYYIKVDVKIGRGRVSGRTNCKCVFMSRTVETLYRNWNRIVDEPYDDLDINLCVLSKYKIHYGLDDFVFPALYLIYEKLKGYKRNGNTVLVGGFDENGILKNEVFQGDFYACKDICADRVIVGDPRLDDISIPEGLQVFKTRSVEDIKSKLFEK